MRELVMKVPLLDLTQQYRTIRKEIDSCIRQVLKSGRFILGDNVAKFEEEFARYCGIRYAVGVASGTDALELSLRALGIGRGDKVITTPFTFIATVEAIVAVGAKPIFVDISLDTYNIDEVRIEERLTTRNQKSKVKAVIPVHLYGQPCDMDAIIRVSKKCRLKVIEDCAQAAGAEYRGKKVGSFGDCGAFSFFPSKNLGGYGDGGMVVTDDEKVASRLRMLRFHGAKDKYHHIIEGMNSRLDELHAAILRVKLRYLDKWNESRRKNTAIYNKLFFKNRLNGLVTIPEESKDHKHIYHLYAVRAKERDNLQTFLKSHGITTLIHYPVPVHLEEVYKHLGHKKGDFPNAELAASQILSLPMYPELKEKQIEYVVKKIKTFYNHK